MKSVLIGVVAAIAIAFAANAAYNNFAAGNNQQNQAAQPAQPASTAATAATDAQSSADTADLTAAANDSAAPAAAWQQQDARPMVAAATPARPAARPAANNRPANRPAVASNNRPAAPTNNVVKVDDPAPQMKPAPQNPAPTPAPVQAVKKQTNDSNDNPNAGRSTGSDEGDWSNPNSVNEYEFAFVDPQFIGNPLDDIRAAEEQSVQDVLSPSAPN